MANTPRKGPRKGSRRATKLVGTHVGGGGTTTLAQEEPSAESLREMPEIDFSTGNWKQDGKYARKYAKGVVLPSANGAGRTWRTKVASSERKKPGARHTGNSGPASSGRRPSR